MASRQWVLLRACKSKVQCRFYSTPVGKSVLVENHPAPHAGNIRVLLLNRPDNRNALSRQLCTELDQQVQELRAQDGAKGVRALVLASNVDKAFCAGADLKERKQMTVQE